MTETDEEFDKNRAENYDYRDKEVGDRVLIWDNVASFYENGDKTKDGDITRNHPMIVIDNKINEFARNLIKLMHL